jgi:hypothetical protein
MFFFLGFDQVVFQGPFGVHFMRQADSLSFASNYFNNGFHFFKPELYVLSNNNGRAACEFPITYYLTALLYTVLGKQFYVQRFIHLIISYLGVFFVFKLSKVVTKDVIYSILVSLIFFTSTVFNYYSFNYLPDAPALGFALMGWFFVVKSLDDDSDKYLIPGFIFFTLSGLIKITYLINPLAVLSMGILSKLFFKQSSKLINKKIILYGLLTILVVGSWNIYMLWYNEINHSHSFNTKALPIWSMSQEGILQVWEHFTHYWYSSYFYQSVFHVFYLSVLVLLLFRKKIDKRIAILILFLFFGSLSYFILFFRQFKDHDYYFLAFFPFIFLVLIYSLSVLKRVIANEKIHVAIKLLLLILVVSGLFHSQKKMKERIIDNVIDNKFRLGLLVNENKSGIDSLKIEDDAKFVVAPENCANGALLYLDRKGWAVSSTSELTTQTINDFAKEGAHYLLVADDNFKIPDGVNGKLIYCNNGLKIFKLISAN